MKHIGWVKYCVTSTSLSTKDKAIFMPPWPCNSYFSKKRPGKDNWQFFYKKIFIKASKI